MAGSALHQRLCATLAACILTAGRFWVTGRTASKPTLRSGSCANQSPTWSHSEATNSCILREFKSFCQIFSPTSTFDIGNLSATDETLSSRIGRRLQVTPTLALRTKIGRLMQVTRKRLQMMVSISQSPSRHTSPQSLGKLGWH
jgi:hypothetical protein